MLRMPLENAVMSEQLEERVARLERKNHVLQAVLGTFLIIQIGVAIAVVATSEEIPDVIEARAFHVLDANGAMRASVGLDGIGVLDANETLRAVVSPTGIGLLDANAQLRALMSPAGIGVHDETGAMRGLIRVGELGFYDPTGTLLWRAPE